MLTQTFQLKAKFKNEIQYLNFFVHYNLLFKRCLVVKTATIFALFMNHIKFLIKLANFLHFFNQHSD